MNRITIPLDTELAAGLELYALKCNCSREVIVMRELRETVYGWAECEVERQEAENSGEEMSDPSEMLLPVYLEAGQWLNKHRRERFRLGRRALQKLLAGLRPIVAGKRSSICPNCETGNEIGLRFCGGCGSALTGAEGGAA